MITVQKFQKQLLAWFDQFGRHDLPWQKNKTPYRVWVSEIMLQQTQVTTVIPYFQRFMKRFPNLKQLAAAEVDEVLQYWSGLGYYARGRNLHQCAKLIISEHKGRFPNSVAELCELPGIGESTAGAIVSLAKNRFAAILDGNVKRVLTRHFAIAGWPEKTSVKNQLWQLAREFTSKTRCGDYNQAMMDLGATICTRSRPNCERCPLHTSCLARQRQQIPHFPTKKPTISKPKKQVWMLLLENAHQQLLLERRPPTGIWGSLWCFPECTSQQQIASTCQRYSLSSPREVKRLPPIRHVFSHFELLIKPILLRVNSYPICAMDSASQVWYNIQDSLPGGIPAPVEKILANHATKGK